MKQLLFHLIILFCLPFVSFCQDENVADNITETYIAKYKQIAMQEQIRVGIPAAITLAQGIHESASGTSDLVTKANNHFGIKCKKNWTGETFLHDDDALQECFRKYASDVISFEDHSNFLKNNRRYSFLFDIPMRNYADWAVGLRKAGYATNPKYSSRLTELIKKHGLDKYTEEAIKKADKQIKETAAKELQYDQQKIELEQAEKTQKKLARKKSKEVETDTEIIPEQAKTTLTEEVEGFATRAKKIITNTTIEEEMQNGLKGFYAKKGDLLLKEAVSRNIKYTKLLSMNDLSESPLPADMFIYTEKKYKVSPLKKIHVVTQDETMLTIAQAEGMQLYPLLELNMLEDTEEPAVGAKIALQNNVIRKPQLRKKNVEVIVEPAKQISATTKTDDVNIANNVFTKDEIVQLKESTETQPIETAVIKTVTINTISASDIAASQAELANEVVNNEKDNQDVEAAKQQAEKAVREAEIAFAQQQAEDKIRAIQLAAAQAEQLKNQQAALLAATTITEKEIAVPVKTIKSPSSYKESGVSEELHRMKKVMDEIVYAAPPVKKVKIVEPTIVPKLTKPAQVLPTVKPKTSATILAKNPLQPTSKTTLPIGDNKIGPKLPIVKQLPEIPAMIKPKTTAKPVVPADKKVNAVKKIITEKVITKPKVTEAKTDKKESAKADKKENSKADIKENTKTDKKETVKKVIKSADKKAIKAVKPNGQ